MFQRVPKANQAEYVRIFSDVLRALDLRESSYSTERLKSAQCWVLQVNMVVSQIRGTILGAPKKSHNKDYSILGSILGYPYLGNYHMCHVSGEPCCAGVERH